MPWWLKICEVIVVLLYFILAEVLIHTIVTTTFTAVVFGIAYALFMIISLTYILNKLPKSISKYFENKA